jgi:hypothetical protein
MKIIYTNQNLDYRDSESFSIFLAGPTPRDKETKSWRPEVLELLKNRNYKGVVYVPEFDPNEHPIITYEERVRWEWHGLDHCNVVVFWIPRNMKTMPALTTNVEFGLYVPKKKVFYGRPKEVEHCEYLDLLISNYFVLPIHTSIESLVDNIIKECQEFNY